MINFSVLTPSYLNTAMNVENMTEPESPLEMLYLFDIILSIN